MSGVLRGPRRIAAVFLAFAFAYFLSTLVRAITATLSPTLTAEFELHARDLGLLAGGYFLGFAFTQLPHGHLARPPRPQAGDPVLPAGRGRRLPAVLGGDAVLGCCWRRACSPASGVSACLMAPLTGYRRWFDPRAAAAQPTPGC